MVSPSPITASLFIVPFILIKNVLGTDLWSSRVAKAADFYWVMSFPVGTGVATNLPVRTLHHKSVLILLFGSRTKAGTAYAQFGARLALSHRSPGFLQIGFAGIDVLPSCSAFVDFKVWQLGFNGHKTGPGEL